MKEAQFMEAAAGHPSKKASCHILFNLDLLHNMHCTCFHSGGLVMALEEDREYLNGGFLVEQEIVMTEAGSVVGSEEEQDGLG